MPITSTEPLCDACQNLFGNDRLQQTGYFLHHASATSIRAALQLPCSICIRLWLALNREFGITFEDMLHVYPVVYTSPVECSNTTNKVSKITFRCEHSGSRQRHWVSIALESYDSGTEHHEHDSPPETNHDVALKFLVDQFYTCCDTHEKCRASIPTCGFLPTRLVDIRCAEDSQVILCDKPIIGSTYVALSHCWGSSQSLTLTRETAPQLRRGIDVADLPQTFRDAITVARKFEVRYIWIDSMCIFQDDGDDWATEASCMKDIYRNAAFCIAATAAINGDVGLFFERDPRALNPVKINLTWTEGGASTLNNSAEQKEANIKLPQTYWIGCHWFSPHSSIDRAPLNTRGWVAQERYLSPRTLHFTQHVLFWECYQCLTSESFPRGVPELDKLPGYTGYSSQTPNTILRLLVSDYRHDSIHTFRSHREAELARAAIQQAWVHFLEPYTECGMTKESDIFPALQGITQDVVEETLQDKLIAGHLESRLPQDLAWEIKTWSPQLRGPNRPVKWRAPSWSWASTRLPVRFNRGSIHALDMAEIKGSNVEKKPSGELLQASLWIECSPIPVTICQAACSGLPDTEPTEGQAYFTFDESKPEWQPRMSIKLDEPGKSLDSNNCDVHLLILRYRKPSSAAVPWIRGIALVPVHKDDQMWRPSTRGANAENAQGYFRRIGVFDYEAGQYLDPPEFIGRLVELHDQAERKVIELI
ncbi:heterokaryon incompatibility protein-domain-containing protein [Paraphoma chrysanthemicola]|nr:heterokaryon incompatibility protein-domain-containing protein [Paraphoma chrysanthemicola]